MKTYVISLATSTERREIATQQLSQAGVVFEFFDAIHGRTMQHPLFETYDEKQYVLNTGRTVTAGELGCFASHYEMWKKCIELNQPILILEDDFHLKPAFGQAVAQVAEQIDELGFVRLQTERRAKRVIERQSGEFTLYRYTKAPMGSMCYAISPEIARRLLENCTSIDKAVDGYIRQYWDLKFPCYGLYPYTADGGQHCSTSTIGSRQKAKKSTLTKIRRPMHKLRLGSERVYFNLKWQLGLDQAA